jgi:site-specific recombinase XerD
MKEIFYSNLRTALYNVIPTNDINRVIDVVMQQMAKYDLQLKPTEIVVYDNGDADMLKRFFIAKATEGLTEESLKTYRRAIGQSLTQIGRHIKDIKTDDVRLLLASMRLTGKSAAYQNLIRRSLNSFFGWITKEGFIATNPMLRIASIREPKKVRLPFSEEELERLRQNAGSVRNQAIIEFLYSTGCRVSEMCALNIEDLNFVDSEVMVLGKGRKYRMVYFSPRCKVLLQEYITQRNDSEKALFVSDYSNCRGGLKKDKAERIGKSGIEVMMRQIGKRAGINDVHPHRFRRTAATLALKRGMKITDVQKMLGHTDIKTTTIYAISTDDEVKREHEKYLI